MNAFATWLAGYYLQASGVLIFSLAALALVRQPERRLALSASAAMGLLVLLVLSVLPIWPRQNLSLSAGEQAASTAAAFLVLGFATGASLTGLFLLLGLARTAGLMRRSRPASLTCRGLLAQLMGRSSPDLRESDELGQAIALGTIRPAIILPAGVEGQGTPRQLHYLLAHEAAHIRQGDLWLLAALRLLMPVLFLHPLYWRWRSQLREDQEYQADAAAARSGDVIEYVEALVHWARQFGPARPPAAALGMSASQLQRRVRRLLAGDHAPAPDRTWKRTAWLSMASLVVCLSPWSLSVTGPLLPSDPVGWAESSRPTGNVEAYAREWWASRTRPTLRETQESVVERGPMPAEEPDRAVVMDERRQLALLHLQIAVEQWKEVDWRPSVMLGAARQRLNTFAYRWIYLLFLEYLKRNLAESGADGPGYTAWLPEFQQRAC